MYLYLSWPERCWLSDHNSTNVSRLRYASSTPWSCSFKINWEFNHVFKVTLLPIKSADPTNSGVQIKLNPNPGLPSRSEATYRSFHNLGLQQTFKFAVCPLDKFKTRLLKPCHEHQISDLECLLLTLIVLWCITKKNSGTSYTVIHFVGTFNILRMSIYTITRKIRSSILCCIYDDDDLVSSRISAR